MTRTLTSIAVAALLSLGACGGPELPPNPGGGGEFKSQINLAPLLPANADLVGIAVSPEGKRYVLDRNSGLYQLEAGAARLVYDTPDSLEMTDIVAMGNDRFAVTAVNDGYLLDLHNQSFNSYFCYFPSDLPTDPGSTPTVPPPSVSQALRSQGIDVIERTESVAFNPVSLQLFAQPQTIRVDTGQVVGSELFTFADSGGQPIAVLPMPELTFIAGGMVTIDGVRLLLGRGSSIYEMAAPTSGPTLSRQLADATIEISGLALDTDGDLLLLDRANRRLLELN